MSIISATMGNASNPKYSDIRISEILTVLDLGIADAETELLTIDEPIRRSYTLGALDSMKLLKGYITGRIPAL